MVVDAANAMRVNDDLHEDTEDDEGDSEVIGRQW